MASIQKREKTYQYTISRMIDGKSKPIRKGGFKTKAEAKAAAAEMEASLNKGIVPHLKPVPFDEYFENWINVYKVNSISKATLKHYEYSLKAVKEYFGSKPLQQINRNEYQLFLNEFGENKAKETVEKVNNHIRACAKDAVEDQIIPFDFTRKTVLKFTVAAKSTDEKHLNVKESELLLKELHKRTSKGLGYYLLLLGLTTGLRFEELVGLTIDDFDFTQNMISVNKTWGYNNRMPKGFGPTKNKRSNRIIEVDDITMNQFNVLFKTLKPNLHGLAFYSPESKYQVISNTNANKLLKKTLSELGFDSITVHGLRHTHACVMLYRKVSIYYVSERLGHQDIETTHRHYSHITKELREEDAKRTTSIFAKMIL